MNELAKQLTAIKRAGKKALIPFITAGDPDLAVTEKLMAALAENGADVIELGIPFSDPLADGPVLQLAAGRALASGTTAEGVFEMVARFRKTCDLPVALLAYYNPVYRYGLQKFCRRAAQAGVSGLVVPDLPLEEAADLDAASEEEGIINVRFLAPTTSDSRLEQICKSARGFIYCVTVTGVTGKQAALDPQIAVMLAKARRYTDLPLALGFGISEPEQAKAAAKHGDCVIVGSALVDKIASAEGDARYEQAGSFVRSLKEALES